MPNTLIYYFSSKMEVHPKTGLTFWYSFCSFWVCARVCLVWIHCVCSVLILCILKWYDSVLPWCFKIYFTFFIRCECGAVVVRKNPFDRRLNFFLWVRKSLAIAYTLRCVNWDEKKEQWIKPQTDTEYNVDDDEFNAKKRFCLEVDVTFKR